MATLDELIFSAKLEAWRQKMFHIFHFLQCEMVLGIINPLQWIFNAITNEKSCLISTPFLSTYIDVRTVNFFPPAESWLVNSNFPRSSRIQERDAKPAFLTSRKVRRECLSFFYGSLLFYVAPSTLRGREIWKHSKHWTFWICVWGKRHNYGDVTSYEKIKFQNVFGPPTFGFKAIFLLFEGPLS